MSEEKTFFEYEDVKVTNTRFISGSQTYAMSNITSVKTAVKKPSWFFPSLLLFIGAMTLITGAVLFGLVLAAIGAVLLVIQKTTYSIMLATSAGETSALKTHQKDYLDKVVNALNDAIIHRG